MTRLDADGWILPEADLANVQPEYEPVPAQVARALGAAFGSRLHSGYLYGSVVRGNAVPGRSDVDVLAILRAAPSDDDRAAAARVEHALTDAFPVLLGAGVAITHLGEVRSPSERYGLQVFLRELCVCVLGDDLRPGLPRTRPSAAVAAAFHADTPLVLARARRTIETSAGPEAVRRACRVAARRMVQGAFALVMARDGAWATVLEDQAAAVSTAFPEWAEATGRALEQARRPVADPDSVRELIDTLGRWVGDGLAGLPPPGG
jgi:predicted nucleotidyltransferase